MSVFKTYDVRGVWGQGIDLALAYRLGRALPRHMKAATYLVGHDARVHSPELYRALAAGLMDEGASVTGIGLASTPLLHYTQIDRGSDAAVMVTASHNPPQYHGFKVFDASGGSISYDKGLKDVEALLAGISAPSSIPQRTFPVVDGLAKYVGFVAAAGRRQRAWRRRSSSTCPTAPPAACSAAWPRIMGMDAVLLNAEPDGTFPHHDPNPLKEESREQASREVLRQSAAFGVILDGDGDRILFVDEKGRGIENYFLSCLVSEELLARGPGAAIVYDLISSRVLPERIRELGGTPVVSKVGLHLPVRPDGRLRRGVRRRDLGARVLQGEQTPTTRSPRPTRSRSSCASLPPRPAPLRDGAAAAGPLRAVARDQRRGGRQGEGHGGDRAAFPRREGRPDGRPVSISFDDFWFNVRPSNTEPLLRLRLEAQKRGHSPLTERRDHEDPRRRDARKAWYSSSASSRPPRSSPGS